MYQSESYADLNYLKKYGIENFCIYACVTCVVNQAGDSRVVKLCTTLRRRMRASLDSRRAM